mmetsp:Transcript_4603/g.10196  ORF Transcript_4603/g.10196 Transcript_4603/m.10196 type:complete len:84 (-) Transcript_4603:350-601(-)
MMRLDTCLLPIYITTPFYCRRFGQVLRKLWENDIVGEDEVDWWVSKENALQEFFPEFKIDDAVAIRESARRFVEWVQEGEDED